MKFDVNILFFSDLRFNYRDYLYDCNSFFSSIEYTDFRYDSENTFVLEARSNENTLLAFYFFYVKNNEVFSGLKAPFSQWNFIDETFISLENIKQLYLKSNELFLNNGFNKIIYNFKPLYIEDIFRDVVRNDNEISLTKDLDYYIKVSSNHDYISLLKQNQRTALNHLKKMGLKIYVPQTEFEWRECWMLIEETLNRKNKPISMTFDEVLDSINSFKNNYFFVLVRTTQNDLLATSLIVKENNSYWLTAFNGYKIARNSVSYLVILHEFLYNLANQNGVKYIDLGVTTEKGVLNKGLSDFKRSIGGIPSKKYIAKIVL